MVLPAHFRALYPWEFSVEKLPSLKPFLFPPHWVDLLSVGYFNHRAHRVSLVPLQRDMKLLSSAALLPHQPPFLLLRGTLPKEAFDLNSLDYPTVPSSIVSFLHLLLLSLSSCCVSSSFFRPFPPFPLNSLPFSRVKLKTRSIRSISHDRGGKNS